MEKKKTGLGLAKETVGVGVGVMAGHGVLGTMGGLPGMPAAATTGMNTAGAGLNLVAVGQTAKVGMGVVGMMGGQTQKKKTNSAQVNKILGL